MNLPRSLLLARLAAAAAAALLLALFAGLVALLLAVDAGPAEAAALQTLRALLAERAPVLVLLTLGMLGLAAAAAGPLHRRWVAAPARLAEQAQLLLAAGEPPRAGPAAALYAPGMPDAPAALQALGAHLLALAAQRDALRADIAGEVARASRPIAQERQRLAALISELPQAVVVCAPDGRVLHYNRRARLQFRALSGAPAAAGGAELLGLGRHLHAVFDAELVAHARAAVQQRLQRGAEQPSAQFVTSTPGGQLLRVRLAPVRAVDADPEAGAADDEAREAAAATGANGANGANGPAVAVPAAPVPLAGHVLLLDRLPDAAASHGPLDDLRAADLLQAVQARLRAGGRLACTLALPPETLWLHADAPALLLALCGLAERLQAELGLRRVQLRLQALEPGLAPARGPVPRCAQIDLAWSGAPLSSETAMGWELDVLPGAATASAGASTAAGLSVREIVLRHRGSFGFERERTRHEASFRLVLPLAAAPALQEAEPAAPAGGRGSRPDFFGFDLFAPSAEGQALDGQPLAELACTVFDTETTGLDPARDEILQIGAVRLLAGRLLTGECFDQLVNPGRGIPAEGIAIHGITPAMVAGQPGLAAVLPAFHAYARDTVLVAHNAAFDLRFLQMKEAATGLRFTQPVLDTLLLSAVLHPAQDSHRLEAIAARFGVAVQGRHTALGDARVTAEIFRRMLPLLARQGITTLGQARAASRQTRYARLHY